MSRYKWGMVGKVEASITSAFTAAAVRTTLNHNIPFFIIHLYRGHFPVLHKPRKHRCTPSSAAAALQHPSLRPTFCEALALYKNTDHT